MTLVNFEEEMALADATMLRNHERKYVWRMAAVGALSTALMPDAHPTMAADALNLGTMAFQASSILYRGYSRGRWESNERGRFRDPALTALLVTKRSNDLAIGLGAATLATTTVAIAHDKDISKTVKENFTADLGFVLAGYVVTRAIRAMRVRGYVKAALRDHKLGNTLG